MHGVFDVDGHKVVVFRSGLSPRSKRKKDARLSPYGTTHRKPGTEGRYNQRMFFLMGKGQLIPVGRVRQALCHKRG
jgi:hypothetical protein